MPQVVTQSLEKDTWMVVEQPMEKPRKMVSVMAVGGVIRQVDTPRNYGESSGFVIFFLKKKSAYKIFEPVFFNVFVN